MITELHEYVVKCDGVCCMKTAIIKSQLPKAAAHVPDGWVSRRLWGPAWQACIMRHFCSEACAETRKHGDRI